MNALIQLTLQTFINPRNVAQSLHAERFNPATIWTAVLLVVVMTGIVQFGAFVFTPESPQAADPAAQLMAEMLESMLSTPFLATIVTGTAMIVGVFCIYLGGQVLGGTGQLLDVFALMTWLNFVQAIVGLLQLAFLVVSPLLAGVATVIGLAAAIALFRATLHFVDVLHGYDSLWAAFGTMVLSVLGLLVAAAVVFAMISGTAAQTGAI